jgi:DHA1 family bicyclomycin/chloramphenicol resistance-like MFS transporter
MMLPAFDEIRAYYGLPTDSARVAQIVTMFFIGMALAQYIYGPLADRFGRKPVLYAGFGIYALGAIGAIFAPSLGFMLASRLIWGIGAASPRVISISIVRDYYSGDRMSRAMSYIMAVFVMVPVFAPTIGAALIAVFPWQAIFVFCLVFVAIIAAWTRVLPETLREEDRQPIEPRAIWAATRKVLSNRTTMGYTLALTAIFSVFTSYLASSERIFGDFYGRKSEFPIIFGAIAAVMGAAMLTNARLVERVGTRKLTHMVLLGYVAASIVMTGLGMAADGHPAFPTFVIGLAVLIVFHSLLVPNLNSIAMLPMGHIAGTASAVIGTISLAVGSFFGAMIDRTYTDSAMPLLLAFLGFGIVALAIVVWTERGRLIVPAVEAISLERQGSTRPCNEEG